VRRHSLEHRRGTGAHIDGVGEDDEPVRNRHRELRVRTAQLVRGDAITDSHRRDACPNGHHRAGTLATRRERERLRVETNPLIDLDEIHAHRFYPNEGFARPDRGIGDLLDAEDIRAAGRVYTNRFHSVSPRAGGRNCHWGVGSGEWGVESGEWRVES
jgi:hypothetical protein